MSQIAIASLPLLLSLGSIVEPRPVALLARYPMTALEPGEHPAAFSELMARADQERSASHFSESARLYAAAFSALPLEDQCGLIGEVAVENALADYRMAASEGENPTDENSTLQLDLLTLFVRVRSEAHAEGRADPIPENLLAEYDRLQALADLSHDETEGQDRAEATKAWPEAANPAEDSEGGTIAKSASTSSTRSQDAPEQRPWLFRWTPQPNMVELGVFAGLYAPGRNHELFQPKADRPQQGFIPLAVAAPEFGARADFLMLPFLGLGAEGSLMPTSTIEGQAATLWSIRVGLNGQSPRWRITPIASFGVGAIGVSSSDEALGKDVDPCLYYGGGVKAYLSRYISARVDVRDVVSGKLGVEEKFNGHNFEISIGWSVTLGRAR